jgi:hypothetical protein
MAEHPMPPKSSITQYNNSNAAKALANEEPTVEKITTGRVISAKKTPGQRFKETFLSGDDAKTVWNTVLMDVIVPGIKETVYRTVQDMFSMFLFGDTRRSGYYNEGGRRGVITSYNSIYNNSYSSNRSRSNRDSIVSSGFNSRPEYIFQFESRLDAENVLSDLRNSINSISSHSVNVNYLYSLLGKSGDLSSNNEKWGWTDLSGVRIRPANGLYLLELPPPINFDLL